MTNKITCPLVGAGLVITKLGFIEACLYQQSIADRFSYCKKCTIGPKVQKKKKFDAPFGMKIVPLSDLTDLPKDWISPKIDYAEKKPLSRTKKSKYPFVTMKVNEIYIGKYIDSAKIRATLWKCKIHTKYKFTTKRSEDNLIVIRIA